MSNHVPRCTAKRRLSSFEEMQRRFPKPGTLVWIGLRAQRGAPMLEVRKAPADPRSGLVGDRYAGRSGERQVTLMQQEHLPAIAAFCGRAVSPDLLRRNLLIGGINLLALKEKRVAIGPAILEITGLCHPCSRMERTLGPGGYNAMRGHGGLTARVVRGGILRIGDTVTPCFDDGAAFPQRNG